MVSVDVKPRVSNFRPHSLVKTGSKYLFLWLQQSWYECVARFVAGANEVFLLPMGVDTQIYHSHHLDLLLLFVFLRVSILNTGLYKGV